MKISSAILIKKKCHRHQWFLAFKCERKKESEVAQSCATLCDPMDCNLPGSSVYGIFQVRVLEWVALSFSRGSSQPMDRIRVSLIAGRFFTTWATTTSDLSFNWPLPMSVSEQKQACGLQVKNTYFIAVSQLPWHLAFWRRSALGFLWKEWY